MPFGVGTGPVDNITAGAGTGFTLGGPAGAAIGGGAGLILSILGGVLSSEDSPYDEATRFALEQLAGRLDAIGASPYSKADVEGKVGEMKQTGRGAADVASGKIGASIAESLSAGGAPKGEPSASIYVSELAPVIARGEEMAVESEKFGMNFLQTMDDASKRRLLTALGMLSGTSGMQPGMTPGQEGAAGFLQVLNLLTTGAGNFAQMYRDLNYKPIEV